MKILHLTLKKIYFDLIASGLKKTEYREYKLYWKKRIEGKEYDVIIFKNGYGKDVPTITIKYLGWCFVTCNGKKCYRIELGKILEIKNYA